jgi:plasmid stabilization system protein ParE
MKFFFHEGAEEEFDEAIRYYEERRPGLGLEFAEEVYGAIARIVEFPNAWTSMSKRTRRCLLHRFPFGVIYQVRSEAIRIIAIADLRRRPGYWRGRE